jgi:hypothetical protein
METKQPPQPVTPSTHPAEPPQPRKQPPLEIVEFRAAPATVDVDTTGVEVSWRVTGAETIRLDGEQVPERGSRKFPTPTTARAFVLTAAGASGAEQRRQVRVTVSPWVGWIETRRRLGIPEDASLRLMRRCISGNVEMSFCRE